MTLTAEAVCAITGCHHPATHHRWCQPHHHYVQQLRKLDIDWQHMWPRTIPCDGICGKPHPFREPPDPPLPPGLLDAVTRRLDAIRFGPADEAVASWQLRYLLR